MKQHPLLFVALCLMPLVSACDLKFGEQKKNSREAQNRSSSPQEPLLVRVVHPTPRELNRTLDFTGEVRALCEGSVAPRISGVRILAILKHIGEKVVKGEPMVRLEAHDLIQARDEARMAHREALAKVDEAALAVKDLEAQLKAQEETRRQKKKDLDRLVAQEQGGAAAGMDLDSARYEYQKASTERDRIRIQIEQAQASLKLRGLETEKAALAKAKAEREVDYAQVLAPFTGIVSSRSANLGQLVAGEASILYRIFDPKSLVIQAFITQRDLRDVHVGQPVRFQVQSLPHQLLPGQVSSISPVVEKDTGTILVRIRPARPQQLKPGLFVAGQIVVATRKEALTVSRKAVAYERQRPYLYLVQQVKDARQQISYTARRFYFREGLATGNLVEVLPRTAGASESLRPEDWVVTVGLDRLRDGDSVRLDREAPKRGAPPQLAPAKALGRKG